jgi:hydrogenase nickel incorporation protein HypA/HybF
VHEFAIASSIRDTALAEAKRHQAIGVVSVTCRFGVLRRIVPEIMTTAFELSVAGTLMEGATLKMETEGIQIECRDCGSTTTIDEAPFECPGCGSHAIRCSGGDDILLVSMEISQGDSDGDSRPSAARREEPGECGRDS